MEEVTIQAPAWLARSHKLVSQDPPPTLDLTSVVTGATMVAGR